MEEGEGKFSVSSDVGVGESWISCDVTPPTTADDSATASGVGQPSSGHSGHVNSCRPVQLDYSSSLGSKMGYRTQGGDSIYSPSTPQICSPPPSATTPVAAPRSSIRVKQLEGENTELKNEIDFLRRQNTELSVRASMLKEANERNVKRMNEENERNIEKISHLELSGSSADVEKGKLEKKLRDKDEELYKEQQERRNVETSLSALRIDYEQIDRERQRLVEERDRLKAECKRSPSVEQVAPLSRPGGRDTGVYRRLNEAIREKRELEEKLADAMRELDELTVGKRAAELENFTKLQQLQEENERIKREQLTRLEEEKRLIEQQLQERTNQLREAERLVVQKDGELSALYEQSSQMEQELRQELMEKEQEFDGCRLEMESILAQKEAEMDEARAEFSTERETLIEKNLQVESEMSKLESSLELLGIEKEEYEKQLTSLKLKTDEVEEENKKLSSRLHFLTAEKKKIQTSRDSFKQEAAFIITDLEEVNKKLQETSKERDDVQKRLGIAMNELSKRNMKLDQSEELTKNLKKTIEERDEKISLLDIQLRTYHSDFDMERKAREEMAEGLSKVQEELQRKDLEVKRLHSQLNKSAANQMKAEMAEMEFYTSVGVDDSTMQYAAGMQHSQQPMPYIASGLEPQTVPEDTTHPPTNQGAVGQYQMHAPGH